MAQIATKTIMTPDGAVEVPILEPGDVSGPVKRIQTPSGVGVINLADPGEAAFPWRRIQTPDGVRAYSGQGITGSGGQPVGGDGTGVGSPAFEDNITTTKYAQADLGMDGSGSSAINSTLTNAAADGTEIVFEPGTYLIDPPSDDTGVDLSGLSNFALKGDGATRGDVRFRFPNGEAGRIWLFDNCANIWLANFVIDQSTSDSTYIEMQYSGDGDFYGYNLATVGAAAPENEAGPPAGSSANGAGFTFAAASGSISRLINYQYVAPPVDVEPYPDNLAGIAAFQSQDGVVEVINNHIANRGEHAMYASRTDGDIRVEGGYFHNNFNTNMRISGEGSYIRNATIHIDKPPGEQQDSAGNDKAMRGLRVEDNRGSNSDGATGGFCENCDFVKETDVGSAGDVILVDGSSGRWTVRDCRIRDESNDSNAAIRVDPIGAEGVTPPTPHDVVIDGVAFTGSGDSAALDSARSSAPTEVRDSCLTMDGPGFTGDYTTSGMSYTSCERATID